MRYGEGWSFYTETLCEERQEEGITKEMIIFFIISVISIDSIISQPELDFAHVGICVLDLERDSVIYTHNCRNLCIPASNMKIITTGASLLYLGPEFRFKTSLAMKGSIKKNRLRGDIIVIGGGDPTFNLEHVEQFVAQLEKKKIREITGNIVVDENYFKTIVYSEQFPNNERLPVGWAWHYLDARYAPEISALSMNKNSVNVKMTATRLGDTADVVLEPETEYISVVNTMITKYGKDSIIIFRRPEDNVIFVDGGIGMGHTRDIQVSVKDPALFAGHYFKERLAEAQIKLRGDVVKRYDAYPDSDYVIIDSVYSAPLVDILDEMNHESENLYAEILLKTLGAHYYGDGSFEKGIHIVKRFLKRCGIDTSAVSIWDGSGLSRHNLISPYFLTLVLRYMYHTKYSELFYGLLPSSGEGTLERRFRGFGEMMRAKTGTLHAVSCISGYLKVGENDYCFSMMFNNFTCQRKMVEEIQEQIITALVAYLKEKN